MSKITVVLLSILIFLSGLFTVFLFCPFADSGVDPNEAWPYFIAGIIMIISSIGIYLLNNMARIIMLTFSFIFIAFFVYETVFLLKTDNTGQGLVGLFLISHIMITSFFAILFLTRPKIKRMFS